MDEVIPNLYLSGFGDVSRSDEIFIVNCTKDLPMKSCIGMRIDVDDDGNEVSFNKMFDMLPYAVDTIESELRKGNKVVVHCLAGQQRSPTVVAAYLMKYHYMKMEQAVAYVRKRRKEAFFWSINFLPTLTRYQKLIDDIGNSVNTTCGSC
jgi:Dual specificity phosphatase, catalytic domain